jgi:hypothetical protein
VKIRAQAVFGKRAILGSRSKSKCKFESFFQKTPLLPTPENVPGTLFFFEPPPQRGVWGGSKIQTWVDCLVRGGTPPWGGSRPKGSKILPSYEIA